MDRTFVLDDDYAANVTEIRGETYVTIWPYFEDASGVIRRDPYLASITVPAEVIMMEPNAIRSLFICFLGLGLK